MIIEIDKFYKLGYPCSGGIDKWSICSEEHKGMIYLLNHERLTVADLHDIDVDEIKDKICF